jgi:hypothetical protein
VKKGCGLEGDSESLKLKNGILKLVFSINNPTPKGDVLNSYQSQLEHEGRQV